ncbi:MAG: c-type cytochrome [Pseudohongiellaceae bacterium]
MARIPTSKWPGLLAATVLMTYAVSSSGPPVHGEDAGNLYNTEFDIRVGQRYFERQCSRCHGFDARGNDEVGAPDLTGTLSNASSDAGIFNIIREGIQGTAMLPVAADVPDATIWQLVAYINSLRYDPDSVILAGNAEAGERLFYGQADCDSCHMVNGRGGRQGPELSRVGEGQSPDELMTALVAPDAEVDPRWWTLRVTGPDGVVREGFRMGEDSFAVRIMDADNELWAFDKNEIRDYERSETSTMPSYDQRLSESQLDDLVAYLFSLRREQ